MSNDGDIKSGNESDDESDDESDKDEEITHSVPFKCIGAAHENNYQDNLEQAYIALQHDNRPVKVQLRPEPLNPLDKQAIAIDLDFGNGCMGSCWLYCFRTMQVSASSYEYRTYH